ncbi:MAG: hypothetical protein V1659_02970 [Candidatus Woesearchaeota archaeon]
MGEDIKITYETLFDLLRREKNREELQKLDNSFYQDVLDYLADKKLDLEQSVASGFTSDGEKAHVQLQNIKRIIKGIYEKRERKIFQMALNKVRMGSEIIDTTVLLQNEKQLFNELIELLSRSRKDVLYSVLETQPLPAQKVEAAAEIKNEEKQEQMPELKVRIKFLDHLPKFVGKNLEVFGPFENGDEAELPESIAMVLMQKQKAERVEI